MQFYIELESTDCILSYYADADNRLQFIGVHYATTIFPSSHVPSRYQLLLALSQG